MSSTRLPNKVLKTIVGKPMLQLQIERIKHSKHISKLIVATSDQQEDDAIAQLCQQLSIGCFRGSLTNVLDRFYQAASTEQPQHVVRLTGDCPLTDAKVIDEVIKLHLKQNADYTSNCQQPTFPDGLDVEIFTLAALKISQQQAIKPSEREHVTLFIRNHSELFKLSEYQHSQDLSHYRWTVDEAKDFEFVSKVYQALYGADNNFTMQDILLLLKQQPELTQINTVYARNEGLIASLKQDKEQGYE